MKRVFIVNPNSGSKRGIIVGKLIEEICNELNYEYEIHYTKGKNDATKIAHKYKKDECIIYSVGGDGTLNEVVNGIVGSKNYLGIIPIGTGNDFVKCIKKGVYEVDLGKVNDRYFINIASIGIDAMVGYNVENIKKLPVSPKLRYDLSILYTFFTYNYLKVCYKKEIDKTVTLIAVCNGRYYGGKYGIAPNALIDDGLFDIYVADYIPKLRIPKILKKLEKQTHGDSPYISAFTSNKLNIKCKKPTICSVDGEIIKAKEFDFEIIPKAINIYNNDIEIQKYIEKSIFAR